MTAPTSPFARSPDTAATDEELVNALRACARRNVPALRRIHDLTAPRLLGELTQMLGDRQAAEALLTDCYVHVWQQAGTFNPGRSRPGTWLLSIVRQHAIDSLRAQQPATPPDEVDAALRLTDAALSEESPPQEQRILRLAYVSGRSPVEIARALEWPVQRVQQEIRRALLAPGRAGAMKLQGRALEQVAGAYALGSLAPRARRRFEALLARDLAVRRAWQEWEERLSGLARDLPPVRPPDKAWQAIEQRLGQRPPPRAWSRRWLLVAALVLGVAVVLVWTRMPNR